MEFPEGRTILESKGIFTSVAEMSSSWKKTKSHNFSFESIPHYCSKAFLVCLINKTNKKFNTISAMSEYEIPSAKRVDVLQLIGKNKEVVGYEIETGQNNKRSNIKEFPIITIDLRKAPDKVKESFKILENYFKDFIVER
jgi:hypothetical protein